MNATRQEATRREVSGDPMIDDAGTPPVDLQTRLAAFGAAVGELINKKARCAQVVDLLDGAHPARIAFKGAREEAALFASPQYRVALVYLAQIDTPARKVENPGQPAARQTRMITLRIPSEMYAAYSREARRQGESLNTFCAAAVFDRWNALRSNAIVPEAN